jgi:hypothetical protein
MVHLLRAGVSYTMFPGDRRNDATAFLTDVHPRPTPGTPRPSSGQDTRISARDFVAAAASRSNTPTARQQRAQIFASAATSSRGSPLRLPARSLTAPDTITRPRQQARVPYGLRSRADEFASTSSPSCTLLTVDLSERSSPSRTRRDTRRATDTAEFQDAAPTISAAANQLLVQALSPTANDSLFRSPTFLAFCTCDSIPDTLCLAHVLLFANPDDPSANVSAIRYNRRLIRQAAARRRSLRSTSSSNGER